MKKSLLVMPLLAVLTLAGCGNDSEHTHVDRDKDHICDTCFEKIGNCSDKNNDGVCDWCGNKMSGNTGGGSSTTKPTIDGSNFSITKSSIDFSSLGGGVYFKEPFSFDVGGVSWTTSGVDSEGKGTFGTPSANYESAYLELNVIQLKKNGAGYFYNTSGVKGFTTVKITWFAEYSSEAAKYHPVVLHGNSVNPTSSATITSIPAGGSAQGVDTGLQSVYDNDDGSKTYKSVYKYESTYSVSANSDFFKIQSGSTVGYLQSISFEK